MEKVLDKLDKKDAADNTMEKRLRGYENYNGWDDEQRKLVSKISTAYSQYGMLYPLRFEEEKTNVVTS
jgi:hypothetical protein